MKLSFVSPISYLRVWILYHNPDMGQKKNGKFVESTKNTYSEHYTGNHVNWYQLRGS